jgi:hypothetical protein
MKITGSHRLLLMAAPFAREVRPNLTHGDFDAVRRSAFATFFLTSASDLGHRY